MDGDDFIVWPDGTWCYRFELPEMNHMSDDYEVLHFGSAKWMTFNSGENNEAFDGGS